MTKLTLMQRNSWLTGIIVCSALLLGGTADVSAQISDEKRARICTKAEKRYQSIFDKPSADEDVTIVMMYKYTFCPIELSVKQGATVRWVNVDKRTSHSVWFKEAGEEETDRLFGEEMIELKFDFPPGKYPYLCGPHWKENGMIGTVTVVE